MIKNIYILIFCFLILSCEKKEASSKSNYNEKANELINQIVLNNSCNCLLEVSPESMIAISKMENPKFDIRKNLIQKLELRNEASFDSLEKLSIDFKLDTILLKQSKKNINIITKKQLVDFYKSKKTENLKSCPKGITVIQKPIFDKDFKTAVIYESSAFTCGGGLFSIYRYKHNKWISDY